MSSQDHNNAPHKCDDILRMLQPYLGRRFELLLPSHLPQKEISHTANVILLKCSDSMDAWRVFELLKHADNTGEPKPFHVTWVYTNFFRAVMDVTKKKDQYRQTPGVGSVEYDTSTSTMQRGTSL